MLVMQLYRIPQAADVLGITRQALNAAVRDGRIKSQEIGGVIFISEAAIATYSVDRELQRRGKLRTGGSQR